MIRHFESKSFAFNPAILYSETESHFAFVNKLSAGLVHFDAREIVDRETVDDMPLSLVVNLDREGIHDASRGSVGVTVTDDCH